MAAGRADDFTHSLTGAVCLARIDAVGRINCFVQRPAAGGIKPLAVDVYKAISFTHYIPNA